MPKNDVIIYQIFEEQLYQNHDRLSQTTQQKLLNVNHHVPAPVMSICDVYTRAPGFNPRSSCTIARH